MSITTNKINLFENYFIELCRLGEVEKLIFITGKFIHYINIETIKKATIEAFNSNHINIITWIYYNYNCELYNYNDLSINSDCDVSWINYLEANIYNFKVLYLLWIFQLACQIVNLNLQLINWTIEKILNTDYDISDFKKIEFCIYSKLNIHNNLILKDAYKFDNFKIIKNIIKVLGLFETKIYYFDNNKKNFKLNFIELALNVALSDIHKNSDNISFLYKLIKNRISNKIKYYILLSYIKNFSKNFTNLKIFKETLSSTPNTYKFDVLLHVYKQKNIYNYSLEELFKYLDCNIHSIITDEKSCVFVQKNNKLVPLCKLIFYIIMNNDIFALEYLYFNIYEKIISLKYYIFGFKKACKYGKLKIISWFLKKFKKQIANYEKGDGFKILCKNGHFKIAHIFQEYIYMVPIYLRIKIINKIFKNGNLNTLKIKWIKILLNYDVDDTDTDDTDDKYINPVVRNRSFYYNTDYKYGDTVVRNCSFYLDINFIKLIKKYYVGTFNGNDLLCAICTNDSSIVCNGCKECDGCGHDTDYWIFKKVFKVLKWLIKTSKINIEFSCLANCEERIPAVILKKIFQFNNATIKAYNAIFSNKPESFEIVKNAIYDGAEYDILNDFLFFTSCQIYNNLDEPKKEWYKTEINIIDFLCSIEPKYYVNIIDEYGNIEYGKREFTKNVRFY